jgi:hypothetical protein
MSRVAQALSKDRFKSDRGWHVAGCREETAGTEIAQAHPGFKHLLQNIGKTTCGRSEYNLLQQALVAALIPQYS